MDDKLIVFIAQKIGHYVLPSSKLPKAVSLFFPQLLEPFDRIRSDLITFFKILKLHKVFIFKRTLLATVYCRALFSQKSGLSYLLCTMDYIVKLHPKTMALFILNLLYSLISIRLIYYFDTWAIIWHDIVPVFMKICTDLQYMSEKLFRNNNKQFCAQMLQICANLHKSRNNMMSNDGLIIENMDLSHVYLAVFYWFL